MLSHDILLFIALLFKENLQKPLATIAFFRNNNGSVIVFRFKLDVNLIWEYNYIS